MPILSQEKDIYPDDLLERERLGQDGDERWWAVYTRSRREKDLMRRLESMKVAFYSPVVAKKYRSPSGRARTSWEPLFSNYVFLCGDEQARYQAMTTNCVSRYVEVFDGAQLSRELRQIRQLILTGAPVTAEERLAPGQRVRVRSGPLQDVVGTVVERRGRHRLFVAVSILGCGASVEIEDHVVEPC